MNTKSADTEKLNLVFDFDGVIADSNRLKSNAFKDTLDILNLPSSDQLVNYNKRHGGITALKKFEHYVENINPSCGIKASFLEDTFREIVSAQLPYQKFDEFLPELYKFHLRFTCHIISGGNQLEIDNYLKINNLASSFNGLVLGNPKSKQENFEYYSSRYTPKNSIYFGDSELDSIISKKFNMRFLFISHWSEANVLSDALKEDTAYRNLEEAFICEGLMT